MFFYVLLLDKSSGLRNIRNRQEDRDIYAASSRRNNRANNNSPSRSPSSTSPLAGDKKSKNRKSSSLTPESSIPSNLSAIERELLE